MADRIRVMLVDDSRSVIAQLEHLLSGFDHVQIVGKAHDGASAIRLVSDLVPDLILMDIVMPGLDGLATLRILSAKHPEISVAMVSSVGGRPSMAEEAFRLGAVQVLGKPFDRDALAQVLASTKAAD